MVTRAELKRQLKVLNKKQSARIAQLKLVRKKTLTKSQRIKEVRKLQKQIHDIHTQRTRAMRRHAERTARKVYAAGKRFYVSPTGVGIRKGAKKAAAGLARSFFKEVKKSFKGK